MKSKIGILILFIVTFLFSNSGISMNYLDTEKENVSLDRTINSDTYIVGPGDIFSFSMITSNQIINQKIEVSPIGDLIIPLVGKIDVDKMSLSSAFDLIVKECQNKITDSSVDITLFSIKDFKILVLGPENIPTGYRFVNSSTRLLDVFNYIRSDFSDTLNIDLKISSRNIIIESNKIDEEYDLTQYQIDGQDYNNPYLKPGDILKLNYIKDYINISGAVMVSGEYEYKKNEKLSNLINICGGYKSNAALDKIEVTRYINDKDKKIISLNKDGTKNFTLMPYDQILIKPRTDYKRVKSVTVSGEIINPGIYSIDETTTIKEIIDRSGGYSENADTNKIVINNATIDRLGDKELTRILALDPKDRSDVDRSYVRARARSKRGGFSNSSFNLSDSIISNYKLFDKDVIYIPAQYNFVEVIGAVRNPGRYPFNQDSDFKDYIAQAGGATDNATKKYFIIQASTGDRFSVKNFSNYELKSQDIIFIEEKNDYNNWERIKEFVELSSQVLTILAILNGLGS